MNEDKPKLNKAGKEMYDTYGQLSKAKDIPVSHLKVAKSLNAPGFYAHRINWLEFEPWYNEHKEQLETTEAETLEHFKIEIAKRDVILRDLQIAKAKREALDPKEVKDFLQRVGLAQSSVLFTKSKELGPKLAGLSAAEITARLDDAFREVANIYKKDLDKWKL